MSHIVVDDQTARANIEMGRHPQPCGRFRRNHESGVWSNPVGPEFRRPSPHFFALHQDVKRHGSRRHTRPKYSVWLCYERKDAAE